MKTINVLLLIICFEIPIFAQAPAAKPDEKRGKIEYPADGVIDYKEGTFEVCFKLLFDMSAKVTGQEIQCFLLYVGPSNDTGMKVLCETVKTGSSIRVSAGFLKNPVAVPLDKLGWKPDEWHHFAMTWKYADDPSPEKRKMQFVFYLDGKECKNYESPLKTELPSVSSYLVRIGDQRYNNKALFDGVRFSSTARTAEEITASSSAELKSDASTTLVDNFDKLQVADKTRTNTNSDGRIKGIIMGSYEKVPGKYGNALKLFSGK